MRQSHEVDYEILGEDLLRSVTLPNRWTLLLLALLFALAPAGADPAARTAYFQSIDPPSARLAQLNASFISTVDELQAKRDLAGLRQSVGEFQQNYSAVGEELGKVSAPADCQTFHEALTRLVQVQVEVNQALLDTVDKGLALSGEVKAMKEAGATDEAMKARIDEFSAGQAPLRARMQTLQDEASALEKTIRSERDKLQGTASEA